MIISLEHLFRSAQPIVFVETGDMALTERRILLELQRSPKVQELGGPKVEVYDATKEEPPHRWLKKTLESSGPRAVLLVRNIQFFLKEPRMIQTIQNSYEELQKGSRMLICMAPSVVVPEELERLVVVHTDELPSAGTLHGAAMLEAKRNEGKIAVDQEAVRACASAGVGMALPEFNRALTLSLVSEQSMSPDVVFSMKQQILRRSEMLKLYKIRPEDSFGMLGGLDVIKDFLKRACKLGARGILILGPPGTGKSAICKGLGHETGRPLIQMDLGASYDKFVGGSEAKIRKGLQTVDAFGECVLFLDEIEKSLSGTKGNSSSDVTARTMGTFLTWLSDRDPKAYVVATCNSVKSMPPEYLRAERWDSIFFVDLPGAAEKKRIWEIWRTHYKIPEEQRNPDDTGWSGAEIKTCCRLAGILETDLLGASEYVLPISKTMKEDIDELRDWARGKAIWASSQAESGHELEI